MTALDVLPLSRSVRRARGVYYTPAVVAEFIVRRAWDAWEGAQPRVLEPSCGAGAFLEAVTKVAGERGTEVASLVGVDPDAAALESARACTPEAELLLGDTLADPRLRPGSFDLVVGNPPYVNVRQLPKSHSAERIAQWRSQFRTAKGNFDLYVLFFERALELLASGGVCAFIVPNKLAALDYARACRALLLEHTLMEVVDLSQVNVFPEAGVYPYVVIVRKEPPAANHRVKIREISSPAELAAKRSPPTRSIRQASWSAERFTLARDLDVESRATTAPLGERAVLHSGASGYAARQLAAVLEEAAATPRATQRRFVVSGNIDPFAVATGDVRFLGVKYRRPMLDLTDASLTENKRRLYAAPKIVIAGLTQRLEAAWDEAGLALGVQVFAVTECVDDPFYILGLLNSRLLTALFRTRFAAKKLAGNYFAVNKGQLAQLPIRLPTDEPSRRRARDIAKLARRLHSAAGNRPHDQAALERLTLAQYGVSVAELEALEAASAVRRAA